MKKGTWEEFRQAGLLWWINNLLHVFGWAIVLEYNHNSELICYPTRVNYRGFPKSSNTVGYQKVSKFMKDHAEILYKESMDEE